MNSNEQNLLKRILIGMIAFFALVFLVSLIPKAENVFLLPLLFFFLLGLSLMYKSSSSKPEGRLKSFLWVTGISSLVFSLGLLYGVLGMWGYYDINDPLFLGSVIAGVLAFIIGAIGTLLLLKTNTSSK